jgi:hypothetical protein
MTNIETIQLTADNMDNLMTYSQMLNKDPNTIINNALEEYFNAEHKKIAEKNIHDENILTNLDYDEFWDGVEL